MQNTAAAIDVGTNSVKVVVGQLDGQGHVQVLADAVAVARLGECVDTTCMLKPDAQERTLNVISSHIAIAREHNVEKLRVVATSAVRDAQNRQDFVDLIKNKLGIDLEVLPEHDECLYSYAAVVSDPLLGDFAAEQAVVDIGGGSTEIIFGRQSEIIFAKSMKIGAVRLTERCLKSDPPTLQKLSAAADLAEEIILSVVNGRTADRLVGVGGTVVNIARMHLRIPPERTAEVRGAVITLNDLCMLIKLMSSVSLEERKQITGLEPKRADVIIGGALVLERIMIVLGIDSFTVTTRGLRFGMLYEMLIESNAC